MLEHDRHAARLVPDSPTSKVVAIEKRRLRKSGSRLYVDIHVVVDGEMSVRDGYTLSEEVKD